MLEIRINDTELSKDVRQRTASRALIIKDNKVAVLYSNKYDFYLTPGGGVEKGETLEEACIREAQEEAGLIVKPIKKIAILDSNYPRVRITHNYFICELIESNHKLNMTKQEKDQDLSLKWLTLKEAKKAFSQHSEIVKYDTWMQREYIVISELRKHI